jgi:prepilin-type N-terminal cleavage/methylation domain-containing protein
MNKKGFSLVEVLVALMLIGVATLMLSFFSGGFTLSRQAQEDTQAQVLARSYFDTLRSYWSVYQNYTSYTSGNPLPANLISVPSGYTTTTTASAIAGRNNSSRTVTLTISTPKNKTLVFTTQITAPSF